MPQSYSFTPCCWLLVCKPRTAAGLAAALARVRSVLQSIMVAIVLTPGTRRFADRAIQEPRQVVAGNARTELHPSPGVVRSRIARVHQEGLPLVAMRNHYMA